MSSTETAMINQQQIKNLITNFNFLQHEVITAAKAIVSNPSASFESKPRFLKVLFQYRFDEAAIPAASEFVLATLNNIFSFCPHVEQDIAEYRALAPQLEDLTTDESLVLLEKNKGPMSRLAILLKGPYADGILTALFGSPIFGQDSDTDRYDYLQVSLSVVKAIYDLRSQEMIKDDDLQPENQRPTHLSWFELLKHESEVSLLTPEKRRAILASNGKYADQMATVFVRLHFSDIFPLENSTSAFFNYEPYANTVATRRVPLDEVKLLTADICKAIFDVESDTNDCVALMFFELSQAKLLTPDIFRAIFNNHNLCGVGYAA